MSDSFHYVTAIESHEIVGNVVENDSQQNEGFWLS